MESTENPILEFLLIGSEFLGKFRLLFENFWVNFSEL